MKLKKLAVLPLLAVVLLSCMPELVQAADIVQKEDLTGESEHGEPLFDKDAARASTCSGSRIEFNSEYLGYNMYFTTPHNYCVVDFPSGKDYEQNHTQYILFIDTEGTPWDPYEVRDGEYARGYNQSVTNFSGGKTYEVEGQSVTTSYVVHFADFYHNRGRWNEETYPSPVHQPPVIHMPSRFEGISDEAIEYLLGCLTSGDMGDCRVTAGDSDNPDVNEPGGVPGSIDNPVYDKNIGRLEISSGNVAHKDGFWDVIAGTEDFIDNIRWKKKTSTGFNLADNDYPFCRIQVKVKCEMGTAEGTASDNVHTSDVKPLKYSMKETYFYKPMPKGSSQSLNVSYNEILPHFPKLYNEYSQNSFSQSYFGTMKMYYYMRVVVSDSLTVMPDSKSWKCGDWRLYSSVLSDEKGSTQSGDFDEDDNWVPDGDEEDVDREVVITDGDEDVDEAVDEQYEKDTDYGTDDVKELVKQVGQFPKLIKKLFSFLPSWCLTLFAFGFACMIVLLVIKTIRG